MMDKHGKVRLHVPASPKEGRDPRDARPEIDRTVLRKMLLDAVPAGSVKWGHRLASVPRPLGGGQHEITFTNGATVVSDILVGADGANSRVRPLVSSATLIYTGETGSEISLAPEVVASDEMKDVRDIVGEGTVYASQDGKTIAVQRNGSGRIRAYLWHKSPVEWQTPKDPKEARRVFLDLYHDWAPWMRKLIKHCDDNAIYHRPIFQLPSGHRWEHVPGVTLIGDAAHLLPPNGAGANLAMLDGLELGILLADAINNGKSVEEREAAVTTWEEKMLAKAEKIAKEGEEAFEPFEGDAPDEVFEQAKAYMTDPGRRREM